MQGYLWPISSRGPVVRDGSLFALGFGDSGWCCCGQAGFAPGAIYLNASLELESTSETRLGISVHYSCSRRPLYQGWGKEPLFRRERLETTH